MYYRIFLSPANEALLVSAVKNKTGVRLTFDKEDFDAQPLEHHVLFLNQSQVDGLEKAGKSGSDYILKLSAQDVEKNVNDGGSIFGFVSKMAGPLMKSIGPVMSKILPTLGMAGLAGATTGIATSLAKKGTDAVTGQGIQEVSQAIQKVAGKGNSIQEVSQAIQKASGNGMEDDVKDIASLLNSKNKISNGKKRTYTPYSVNITDEQADKLVRAVKEETGCAIRINYENIRGSHQLYLTDAQIKNLENAFNNKKGVVISMSKTQVKNQTVEGGFLGTLLATLAGTILPSLLGIGNGMQKKK